MTSEEIRGELIDKLLKAKAHPQEDITVGCLVEIAAQLAELNENFSTLIYSPEDSRLGRAVYNLMERL